MSFVVHLVIEECDNQTHYLSYYKMIDTDVLQYLTCEKSDTMCKIVYWYNLWYIWSLKSEWLRHNVLAIPQVNIRHYMLADLLCYFVVHLVIDKWFKQKHCVWYSTNIDSDMLQWSCVLAPVAWKAATATSTTYLHLPIRVLPDPSTIMAMKWGGGGEYMERGQSGI